VTLFPPPASCAAGPRSPCPTTANPQDTDRDQLHLQKIPRWGPRKSGSISVRPKGPWNRNSVRHRQGLWICSILDQRWRGRRLGRYITNRSMNMISIPCPVGVETCYCGHTNIYYHVEQKQIRCPKCGSYRGEYSSRSSHNDCKGVRPVVLQFHPVTGWSISDEPGS